MEDLMGLDWSSGNKNRPLSTPSIQPTQPTQSTQSLPQPSSGRSTPGGFQIPTVSRTSTPVIRVASQQPSRKNDSFATLLSNQQTKQSGNLTLQERQRQIHEEKLRKQSAEQKLFGNNDAFLDSLRGSNEPSRTASPAGSAFGVSGLVGKPPSAGITPPPDSIAAKDDDDILAAFNSSAPVDSSTNFPPPQSSATDTGPLNARSTFSYKSTPTSTNPTSPYNIDEDDDPFGLGSGPSRKAVSSGPAQTDDDDILGMLGKPVEEVIRETRKPVPSTTPPDHESVHPQDKAVAELVDMGFPADKAAIALENTDTGINVQAAVSLLLNQAHSESQKRSNQHEARQFRDTPLAGLNRSRGGNDDGMPPGMRTRDSSKPRSRNSSQGPTGEKDVTQMASELRSSVWKQANSLWKSGQKKVQRAVADFQQEGDPNQPKWMRDAQAQQQSNGKAKDIASRVEQPQSAMTNEALLLEGRAERPSKPKARHPAQAPRSRMHQDQLQGQLSSPNGFTDQTYPPGRPGSQTKPAWKLTQTELEVEQEQVYISPARRRKPKPYNDTPQTASSTPPSIPKPSLPPSHAQSKNPFVSRPGPLASSQPSPAPTSRPKPPPRRIPTVSQSDLRTSTIHRNAGTQAFKRGDYTVAHTSYTAALLLLPSSHPITIIIYCNRAITNLKVGDPKAAISDADAALSTIGPSRGDGESIHLDSAGGGADEAPKDMKEFYGKALMRKAEALEHMEKWSEAAKIWREAVEAGVGGSVSIQGRNRCEKAANGSTTSGPSKAAAVAPKKPASRAPAPKPRSKASALADLSGTSSLAGQAASAEAVRKLREANAQAERADDEKFALTDAVDAKLAAWKGTKVDNLRALLGSLDLVLWPEAGWKKVGMQDLVLPGRVKIVYMKAIAKVHPDKISQSATTEQRMISGAVFSVLNEAWDKFKTDNNL